MRRSCAWRGKLWTGINGRRIERKSAAGQNSDSFCGPDSKRLTKVVGSNRPLFPIPKDLAADLSMQVSPVEVLGVRKTIEKEDNLEVLIRWREGTLESATWEQAALIQETVS